MRKGEKAHQVPTLWHMGIGKPFDVMRKRKGDTRWRRLPYQCLTRSSAERWFRCYKSGLCLIRRDVQREMWQSVLNPNNWKQIK